MARPTKIGLEYFSLDVDLFEDEKVIPISSEFGAKGECALIRVLCAIYRNGYFVECSEAFKFKIAKQANIQHNLVSEVIAGLVKWGFFDKTVFDSFSVLTSKGIQKRWKEATRKRVLKDELNYWILEFPTQKQGFMAEETLLNRSESTQSKVKESKEKKREREERKISPPPKFQNSEQSMPIDEIGREMSENEVWIENVAMRFKFDATNADNAKRLTRNWIENYIIAQKSENVEMKNRSDAYSHCARWINTQLQSQNGKTEKQNGSPIFKA